MLKERPYELNQKLKRMQESRDNLKINNREKTLQNKTLRDRNKEITESRNKWKSRTHELEKALELQKNELTQQIEAARKETENEKKRFEEEQTRANTLQAQVEEIKKKPRFRKFNT